MANDTLADALTRIRNAQRAGHASVKVADSNVVRAVLEVLRSEGFIERFEQSFDKSEKKSAAPTVDVVLKYYSPGDPIIRNIRRVSTPGRRFYIGSEKLGKVASGLGVKIISTSEGVMSDREARRRNIGGEVMALVG